MRTWQEMLTAEPRLARIDELIESANGDPWKTYDAAKSQLRRLAGFHAEVAAVKTTAAYECGIDHITEKLGI